MISRSPSLPIIGNFCNFFWIVKFVCCIGINPKISHFYKERLISFLDFLNYLVLQSIYFPQTGSVHSSCHLHFFFSWLQLCYCSLENIVEFGNGKNLSVAKKYIYFFLIHSGGYYIRHVFPCILTFPLYVLLHFKKSTPKVPNGLLQMSLLFSSGKKKSKGSSRSKNSFVHLANIFGISAVFLDIFSLFTL